jgi:hypothetical protein
MSPIHWVARGTGIPKDRDEVNRQEVCECDVMGECVPKPRVYLQQNKKKSETESKNCHAKTMLSLEKPIKLI